MKRRCAWARNPLAVAYHDREWGVPVRDDRRLFEFLLLEGAQAGLSWDTILAKRENYRAAFDGFDPEKIWKYGANKTRQLMRDPGIVRNRLKIESAVSNAKCFLTVREEFGSFARFVWGFVDHEPIVNAPRSLKDIPARTEISDALSKALKRRGFKFVGSTLMYAFMQAAGMVDDHTRDCFRCHRGAAGR